MKLSENTTMASPSRWTCKHCHAHPLFGDACKCGYDSNYARQQALPGQREICDLCGRYVERLNPGHNHRPGCDNYVMCERNPLLDEYFQSVGDEPTSVHGWMDFLRKKKAN